MRNRYTYKNMKNYFLIRFEQVEVIELKIKPTGVVTDSVVCNAAL